MAVKLRDAASRGNTQEVLRLLDDGAKIQPDEDGRTALHLAASSGHADVVAALLLAKCDVNVSDSAGCTALQRAAADGHLEVVQMLLKHGADVNRQDAIHGNTALHEASWKGYSRTVEALGKARANLHLKNCGGFAALHLCCQNGHNQSCRELLLAGCNPDLQNNYGDTPLHTSARYGHAGVTRILISAECKVSEQNKNGDTALHIAAAMGRRKMTRILLEARCDKHLKNKQNESARDIATRKDLNEILVILSNSSSSKSKSGKSNDKKREKQESGTSSKDSSTRHKDKKKHKNGHKVHFEKKSTGGKQWSPYGCHYYPDPKAFPKPKLDSLPNDPLVKGEQYYLDLAGNICKGPVGVGYTCYCAPFFKHMEERLDRDKRELKQHIDKAHDRLDEKVTNLERRTHGQLTELTRCVVAERALCDKRHLHLAQWLERGGKGRSSERPRGLTVSPPPPLVARARSMDMLIDQPDAPERMERYDKDGNKEHRSLEVLIDGPEEMWREEKKLESWRKQKHRSSSHEMSRKQRDSSEVTQELANRFEHLPREEHNRSFDALMDKSEWRGQPHRRSANELLTFVKNFESANDFEGYPDHNRSFDAILRNRGMPWDNNKPHHKSANMIPVPSKRTSQHNRSFDILVDKEDDVFLPRVSPDCELEERAASRQLNRSFSPMRRELNRSVSPMRREMNRSVSPMRREMNRSVSPMRREMNRSVSPRRELNRSVSPRRELNRSVSPRREMNRSVSPVRRELNTVDEASENVDEWRGQTTRLSVQDMVAKFQNSQTMKENDWRARQNLVTNGDKEEVNGMETNGWAKDYRRAAWISDGAHDEAVSSESSEEEDHVEVEGAHVTDLPYRTRTAVYSPDLHNDSGYSTKLYGSSKGPSPSLSGQLDCEGLQQLVNGTMCSDLPPRPPLPRIRSKDVTHVVTASLV